MQWYGRAVEWERMRVRYGTLPTKQLMMMHDDTVIYMDDKVSSVANAQAHLSPIPFLSKITFMLSNPLI